MAQHGVNFLTTTFEDLFSAEPDSPRFNGTASEVTALAEWNRVLDYLGEPNVAAYTDIAFAINASGLESTTPETQCDSLQSPSVVRDELSGTRYESLLEC